MMTRRSAAGCLARASRACAAEACAEQHIGVARSPRGEAERCGAPHGQPAGVQGIERWQGLSCDQRDAALFVRPQCSVAEPTKRGYMAGGETAIISIRCEVMVVYVWRVHQGGARLVCAVRGGCGEVLVK